MKPMNLKNLPNTVLPNTKIISKIFKNIFGYLGQKYFIPRIPIKEVFSEKSCFKNFAHPLSEGENIKK